MPADKEIRETLPGVPINRMAYVRRVRNEHRELRETFNDSVRREFVLEMAHKRSKELSAAGLTKRQIERIGETGRLPPHLNVHHIKPLDDGGTNDFSNLVIMRKYPDHEALHQYADPQLQGLRVGEGRDVMMPMPKAGIYIADKDAKREIVRDNVPALQLAAQMRRKKGR